MARKKKELPILQDVEILDIAGEGKAIAKIDGIILFVPFGVPGDICTIQVTKKKKSYMEGRIIKIQQPSPHRIEAACEHFTICGGCKWANIPYPIQLDAKAKVVKDAMERIGKLDIPTYDPIMGSEDIYHYRNKLEFTFTHKRWLTMQEMNDLNSETEDLSGVGFHVPGMFDKVLDVKKCYLGHPLMSELLDYIRSFCKNHPEEYPFFDLRNQEGLMRTLMIRYTTLGQSMLVISFYEDRAKEISTLLDSIRTEFPQLTSLMYVINSKCNDTIADLEILLHSGKDYIEEKMGELIFKIGPKSFFQTNTPQACRLYDKVVEFSNLSGNELVYDLYTGTGTIANFVAEKAKSVVGIEYVEAAIEDAKINSQINKISNTLFYAGDMKDILTPEFVEKHGQPDVIITDPPRAGMHDDVIKVILLACPQKIVYVSCNPATQARDLALLTAENQYHILRSQAVDMFPHTYHIENIILLERCQ